MQYEVELKFRINDPAPVAARLSELEATPRDVEEHRDTYFNHPTRNFVETDEALRIRSSGSENRLTWKGPLIDSQSKTRQEIEVECASGMEGRKRLHAILLALGFREVLTVCKVRTPFHLVWQDRSVDVVLDEVEGLGQFVELETLAPASDWQPSRLILQELAAILRLRDSERRSYLQLLLAPDQADGQQQATSDSNV